jgi:hypothetical protein
MKKDKYYVFYSKSNKKLIAWTLNPEYADEFSRTRASILRKTHKLNIVESEKFTLANKNTEIQRLFSEDKKLYVFTNDEVNDWYSTALGDLLDIFQYPPYPIEDEILTNIKSFEYIRNRKRFRDMEEIMREKVNLPYLEYVNNPYAQVYTEDIIIDYDRLIKYKSSNLIKT